MAFQPEPQNQLVLPNEQQVNPLTVGPSAPMPIDASLYANGGGVGFFKGVNQGMEMGMSIAGMPNAIEKLKAAKLLTQHAEAAMDQPNNLASKAFSMGPNGAQFQGSQFEAMPDANLRRAKEAAGTGLLGAQAGLAGAQRDEAVMSTALMPSDPAHITPGQAAGNRTALGDKQAGTWDEENNFTPPKPNPLDKGRAPMPSGGSANASSASQTATQAPSPGAAAVAAGAGGPTTSPNTVSHIQPVPHPGAPSLFQPRDVANWWTANHGMTPPDDVRSAPSYNNGKGGWVIFHKDGSKDVVDDNVILSTKGNWNPPVPFADQLKMAEAQRQGSGSGQGGQEQDTAPRASLVVPSGQAGPPTVDAPVPGAPPAAPAATATPGGPPPANPTPPGSAMPAAPSSTPLAPNAVPSQDARNKPFGWEEPNPADYGDLRTIIGMQGNMPLLQPLVNGKKLGPPYLLVGVDQFGRETRRSINGGPPYLATPYSVEVRMKQADEAIKIEGAMRQEAAKLGGVDPRAPLDVISQKLAEQTTIKNQIKPDEAKKLRDMAAALSTGQKLVNQLSVTDPAKIGWFDQRLNEGKDFGQGVPFLNKFLPKPNQDLAAINDAVNAYKVQAGQAFNNGRTQGIVGKGVEDSIGTASRNPATLMSRIVNSMKLYGQQSVNEVRSYQAMGQGVPADLVEAANQTETQIKRGFAPQTTNAGANPGASNNPVHSANAPLVTNNDQLKALPPKTEYRGYNKKGQLIWATTPDAQPAATP